jgi:tetratricopeptide (TPR) repeat protein
VSWRGVGLACAVVVMLSGHARADGERAAEARRHFQAGTRLYSQGRFQEALVEFEAANRIKPDAALLYDLAQTHRALGHNRDALSYYRAYVEAAPYAPNRDEVLGKIDVAERDLAERRRMENKLADAERRAEEASAAQRTADDLALRARQLMAEAEAAQAQAREAQERAQRVLSAPKTPLYKKWWLWTGVAVVVAGSVTAAVVLTRPGAPSTSQGNFDF